MRVFDENIAKNVKRGATLRIR